MCFMFLQKNPEDNLLDQEKKLQELLIQIENLDQASDKFLEELNVTEDQLTQFISNRHHFDEDTWATLSEQKKILDDKIETQLKSIHNPLKTKKTYKERRIQNHWLYVK